MDQAEIGIFGGSGLYSLLEDAREVKVDTPFGSPSDKISLGKIEGRKVAFLPRHGKNHQHPPHMIPYRANMWALSNLGITRILGPCAAGSLQPEIKPGDFVICDQFVDRTSGRKDTFYDGPMTTHISSADPYCPELREMALRVGAKLGLQVHEKGTVVVVQGPRFSTRAESRWFKNMGWEVINMTQYPEVVLARELEMCYLNISLITDYDVWQDKPVSHEEVMKVFNQNLENIRRLLFNLIPKVQQERHCSCNSALKTARI
ncbi:MAG TPA: S-methyl-5'-thioadenosine phosphorylase [Candidatus Bathyarchaeia archaeon]|nr:MAG: methylthioadenosine phosphorylase [Candidatus Bathyarchaeota archaeon RBG_16_48_13]HJX24303.1 S-methyl-5'-thioadenosine phosphorylase [Candidatus Bathyarchaeia archaeon]